MEKIIEITARRDGFRRCGVAHSAKTTVWPMDAFTPEQLEVLKADPMLIVVIRNKADTGHQNTDQTDALKKQVSDLRAELEAERLKVTALTAELDAERQKVADLNVSQEPAKPAEKAEKKGK
ncbi:HI1506-related protein [Yersinia enterocolitica]|uniref:HI1506-related protein n=1 Tax=Yersinia enterocolitica TaxID=630 RepID=UPI0037D5156C|nr:hypothetical protein [Yersinia enterocolitica]